MADTQTNEKKIIYRTKWILGKKWYPFLISKDKRKSTNCLLGDVGYRQKAIYVRRTFSDRFMFTYFNDAIELYHYIKGTNQRLRCFDEIMVEGPQKPRFDIDMEEKNWSKEELDNTIQEVLNQVLDGIQNVIAEIYVPKNVRIFTSHGHSKRSMHIIIDGYYHARHEDAVGFYEQVIQYIDEKYHKYIDRGIYGKMKQLRITGCHKWNNNRVKLIQEEYFYHGDLVKNVWEPDVTGLDIFISSLISVVDRCQLLPSFAPEKKKYNQKDIDNRTVEQALAITQEKLGDSYAYEYEDVDGGIIILNRISPSMCPVCKRVHEKQHPYLYIVRDRIYFNCRRHPKNESFLIGSLDSPYNESDESSYVEFERKDIVTEEGRKIIVPGGTFIFRKKGTEGTESDDIPNQKETKIEHRSPTKEVVPKKKIQKSIPEKPNKELTVRETLALMDKKPKPKTKRVSKKKKPHPHEKNSKSIFELLGTNDIF
jgi:hypothetical protein